MIQREFQALNYWGSNSSHVSFQPLYQQLTEGGVLVRNEAGEVTFSQHQMFSSSSTPAAVISGRPANGRTTWLEKTSHRTYGDWQSAMVEAQTPATESDD